MHATMPLQANSDSSKGPSNGAASLPTITLTPIEEALCQLLDDTCWWIEHYQPQPSEGASGGARVTYKPGWTCEARIAGGWVRDKLLGGESHDLDISLSTLTGHTFALLLRDYLLSPEFAISSLAKTPSSPFHIDSASSKQLVGHVTKIAANPEQSKNLETATAKVAGLQLDFVNLRKEMYVGNSRIPTMTFGTALEDAQRRDITINALFYNVHTREIEDLTEMGLKDMRNRLIRTPLEPETTFLDDPLRVLRTVRFASRFGYTVDESIFACLQGDSGNAIREALQTKVSRERFGIEVDKMMLGPDPLAAITMIGRMDLFDVIFGPPPGEVIRNRTPGLEVVEIQRAVAILAILQADHQEVENGDRSQAGLEAALPFLLDQEGERILHDKQAQRYLFYSAVLLPLRTAEWEEKKGKWQWAGECVIKKGLKLGGNTRDPLYGLWRSAEMFYRPTEMCFDHHTEQYRGWMVPSLGDAKISPRALRALLLRHTEAPKHDKGMKVELRLLWALIADLASDRSLWSSSLPAMHEAKAALRSPVAQLYVQLYKQLKQEDVLSRMNEKTLLNGEDVMKTLAIRPSGRLQPILKRVEAWQFDRDLGHMSRQEARDACKAWLRHEWDSHGIIPPTER